MILSIEKMEEMANTIEAVARTKTDMMIATMNMLPRDKKWKYYMERLEHNLDGTLGKV